MVVPAAGVVTPHGLDVLVDVLRARGFRVIAPTVRGGAIVYDEISNAEDLPVGWTDAQRQWSTHTFGTWHDQFGTSGCVGCGRCITWCPVAIDVTEERAAIRVSPEVDHADR